ncbi:MAG: hypothetical protein JWR12_2836 [Mucilaginibacter sp.]|nr:hypothetical protein [Mucilaginibacter sp.]
MEIQLFRIMLKCIAVLMLLNFIFLSDLLAQKDTSTKKKDVDEIRVKLNDDGSHYLKLTILGQLWFRYNESNPGTTVLKEPTAETYDIGIRRARFQFYGQLTDHAFFYFYFGQDNFNYLSPRKFTPFIQDALAEYKVKKGSEALIFGGGLSIISGLSRFSQPQVANIMSMDIPLFTQSTFDLTDQAGRKLSMYARGQVGKLDYRLILSNPFPITTSGTILQTGNPTTPNSNFAQQGNHMQYQGLLIWNFFDRETHVVAYMPGTYYGAKKVLNLEAGFIEQKNATWSSQDGGQTVNYHPLNCWSVAVFYDAPLNKTKGTALNAYLGYFDTQYGPGYLRYVGIMPTADGLAASAPYLAGSQGNAFPTFGTGHVIYSQFGYLLDKDLLGKDNGTLMPYATLQTAGYDRLDKQMTVFDLGINWFISGNTSKLTLDYQNRPVYSLVGSNLIRNASREVQLVLQYQFSF